jgi:hypothetical protein
MASLSKINVTNSNTMTMKRIMQVWKTEWTRPQDSMLCNNWLCQSSFANPVNGNDFNRFCEFVFDKYGIDIAYDSAIYNLSEFYDMNPSIKERKTIKNVLQPSLSKKSSREAQDQMSSREAPCQMSSREAQDQMSSREAQDQRSSREAQDQRSSKHREEKRDKTKKPDAKRASRVHKESLKIKFDREN